MVSMWTMHCCHKITFTTHFGDAPWANTVWNRFVFLCSSIFPIASDVFFSIFGLPHSKEESQSRGHRYDCQLVSFSRMQRARGLPLNRFANCKQWLYVLVVGFIFFSISVSKFQLFVREKKNRRKCGGADLREKNALVRWISASEYLKF